MQATMEMIFQAKVTCPNCGQDFLHPEVKSKYISLEKQDSDFCGYYNGINPIFYDVMVCRHCGFGFTKETNRPLDEAEKMSINTILSSWHNDGAQYSGLRTLEQAIKAYNKAILCQELRNAKDSVKGSLYLRLGWLYRYQGNKNNEEQALRRTLEFLRRAYERESSSDAKKELRMIYLIGELSYRNGDLKDAIKWFQAVTTHPEADRYPVFNRLARSRWQDIREEAKQKG
ncbi:Tetratricopeptide domain protein [Desulforamulus reducens MI-1]|uniref:Tetratricopeptide domain protein n=2 Tax=Desulforamulus TaxID=2916693 RepID=A4J6X7_DESRM|nr:Tetratricopeptide domain protein [Desulforamulus reducens MI-1]